MAQLYERHLQLAGEDIKQVILIHIAQINQGTTQFPAGVLLLTQRRHQLLFGDDVVLDQQVTYANFFLRFCGHDPACNAFKRSRA